MIKKVLDLSFKHPIMNKNLYLNSTDYSLTEHFEIEENKFQIIFSMMILN